MPALGHRDEAEKKTEPPLKKKKSPPLWSLANEACSIENKWKMCQMVVTDTEK